jgi:signal transduction histidine kinase/CheY-like chemotaxis protein
MIGAMRVSTAALIYSVRTALGAAALILGTWYAALVWIHARTVMGPASSWIAGAAALTAVVFIGCGLRWLHRPPPERIADACVVGISFGVLANDGLYLFFFPEPQYLHGLAALLVAGGLFLVSRVWFGMLAAGVVAVVLFAVARSGATEGWAQPAILLATSGALAVVIHVWQRAYLKRLEFLRRESEGRRLELERSVTALEIEVAERERLQTELLKTQNLESLGRMAGGVAHDFNNLLLIILAHAELARSDLPDTAPARGSLDEVITATERAALLTGQLLSYAGRGEVRLEPLQLNELVRGTVDMVRESLPSRTIFELDLAEADLTVEGDPGQLQQIVLNLLLNAGEALSESGGAIRVRTGVDRLDRAEAHQLEPPEDRLPGRYACLEVRDTGRGIAPENRSRIFDPFFTTKREGRGLGLAAALGIARSHGGGFAIESAPDSGSCFRLLMPTARGNSRGAEPAPVATSLSLAGRAILVVDDEQPIRSFARRVLEDCDCTVYEASNGDEALEAARALSVLDAVVLDMTMPGRSSRETFARLREARPSLPVLLSSGYEAEQTAQQLIREPNVGFLQKPYPVAKLVAMLGTLLDGAGGRA